MALLTLAVLLTFLFLFPARLVAAAASSGAYDLVILGATPGGIMAAVAAARVSNATANILILERTSYIGGLPANGLGATDIATRSATGGLFLEFVGRVKQQYVDTYGESSQQVKDSQNGYHFEPKVAEKVMKEFLAEVADKGVEVKVRRQFDAQVENAEVEDGCVKKIKVTNRDTGAAEWYEGKVDISLP